MQQSDGTKKVYVGYEPVLIEKLFGPQIFSSLKIIADPESNTWIIEREIISTGKWVEWVRIPGQLEKELKKKNEQ